MSWCVSPWVYPVWDSLCLWDFMGYFLLHVGEIFNYNLFKNFLIPFLFLFFCVCEVAQLCPTLCDPMNCSLPGSSIHGIFQARVLEWVAIAFSLSEKLFISPSILNEILAVYCNLGCTFFLFSTLNIFCHSLLACRDQLLSIWGFPCMLLVASPLLLLIFFLCV